LLGTDEERRVRFLADSTDIVISAPIGLEGDDPRRSGTW